ncbi:MAG: cation diffusion facilitator family transporter [Methylocapsa sp.]|nr:cation diffusion facilitator family transporter [Methylocapsa sp.]
MSTPPASSRANGTKQLKERAALASVAVSALLTAAKLAAGLVSGSLAILSEAGHNVADVVATLLTYFAVRVASKPADEEHQFGHAKAEALAALAETGFLFALAVYVLIEAIARLASNDAEIETSFPIFAVLLISMSADFIRWRSLKRIAKRTRSDALAADALHFSSDIAGSALALCGITAAHFGYPQGDALAALGLVAFIAFAGLRIGKRTINTLMDAAPRGLASEVRSVARSVPGVVDVETLRLRPSGAGIVGDMGIEVSRALPLEHAAAISAEVASEISKYHPDVSVKVSARPVALDNETILERVLFIAANRRIPVHHVTLQDVDGRTSISLDAELESHMLHGRAHEVISALEAQISRELGPGVEVETHIEPLEPEPIKGQPVPEDVRAEIASVLEEMSAMGEIRALHSVRVRTTPDGLVVNYHCRADPRLSVGEVHAAVDSLDRRMRLAFPGIVRIVGHAEPLRQ